MKNVCSFEYFEELNQNLIVDNLAVKHNFPKLKNMMDEFSKYVCKVNSKQDNAIHIGVSFTNSLINEIYITGKNIIRSHVNPMFWPIYGEVDYEFKKGDFYLNQGKDPLEIVDSFGSRKRGEKFFFTKNPFENKEIYKENFGNYLPNLFVEEKSEFNDSSLWCHFSKIPKFKPAIHYS